MSGPVCVHGIVRMQRLHVEAFLAKPDDKHCHKNTGVDTLGPPAHGNDAYLRGEPSE